MKIFQNHKGANTRLDLVRKAATLLVIIIVAACSQENPSTTSSKRALSLHYSPLHILAQVNDWMADCRESCNVQQRKVFRQNAAEITVELWRFAALLEALAEEVESYHPQGPSEARYFIIIRYSFELHHPLDKISESISKVDEVWLSESVWEQYKKDAPRIDAPSFAGLLHEASPNDPRIGGFTAELREAATLARKIKETYPLFTER